MEAAFHFDADKFELNGFDIPRTIFRILSQAKLEGVHLLIATGDLPISFFLNDPSTYERRLSKLLTPQHPTWRACDTAAMRMAFLKKNVYAMKIEGLTRQLADHLHDKLRLQNGYLGAIQVHRENPAHWVLYIASLGPRFRVVERELRILSQEGTDDRDEGLAKYLRNEAGFTQIVFEDVAVIPYPFSPYGGMEHAKRVADLSDRLTDQLSIVVEQVLMRLGMLDPKLQETLSLALDRLEQAESPETLAHACLSVRRLLTKLADILYPPRQEKVGGREVTQDKYRNRLRAYIKENAQGNDRDVILAQWEDICKRLDKLDELANKGIHDAVTLVQAKRLLLSIVVLFDDILSLSTLPTESTMHA